MYYSGNSGSILFGRSDLVDTSDPENETGWRSATNTKITNWTLTSSAQLLDTTTLSQYDKSSVYGLRTHTGTLKLFYYTTQTNGNLQSGPPNNSASYFFNALMRANEMSAEGPGSEFQPGPDSFELRLRLYLSSEGATNYQDWVEFNANLTSVSTGSNVGELVSVDVNFEANGRIIRSQI